MGVAAAWVRMTVLIGLWSAITGCAAWSATRLYESGTHALDRGDTPRAVADLEEAARLLPDSSEIQNHLGIAYEAAGREPSALAAYRRAVALDCSNDAAVRNLRAAEARWAPGASVSLGSAPR
jgi:Flp pilus assembly protein TadD